MSPFLKSRFTHFLFLVLVALSVRVGAAFVWENRVAPEFGFGDSLSYWTLGRAIATGEPYRYGAVEGEVFRTPGYPAILAPLFWIGGENPPVIWARLLGVVFGTLTVVAVWWLARILFDARAAWIAGWITALYPGAIATSIFVLSEAPFGLLMILNLVFWVKVCRAKGDRFKVAIGFALVAGVLAGLATLIHPSWLLFVPFAVVVWMIVEVVSKRRQFFRTGVLSVVLVLGLVLAMMPWWIRNFHVTGHFVPTTLQVGAGLYDGLNPKADGSSNMWFVDDFIAAERKSPQMDSSYLGFEGRVDRRMRQAARTWASENPGRVLELAWVKFLRTWNIWPNEASLSSFPAKVMVCMTYVPVLFLAVWEA
ncbi:MAG: glycosyltransferase family 39 protein, partial [Planctomycetia bacterium]